MAEPTAPDAKTNKYEFNVTMTCSGCSGAVERVLKRLDGVQNYDIDQEKHFVQVNAAETLGYDTVLEKIKKTGKAVNSGKMNEQDMPV